MRHQQHLIHSLSVFRKCLRKDENDKKYEAKKSENIYQISTSYNFILCTKLEWLSNIDTLALIE